MNDDRPRVRALAALTVALVAALVLSPGLFGGFVSDDTSLVVGNARVRHPASLVELISTPFWDTSSDVEVAPAYLRLHRPLVKVAYYAQLQVFGDDPFGFHVVSLLLHLLCAALVFDALRARLGRSDVAGLGAAVVGAMLFGVHPTRVESVAWISGSTDLWMALFALLAERAFREGRSPGAAVLGGVATALAGLAKEPAWLLPIVLSLDAVARGEPRARVRTVAVAAGLGAVVPVFAWALVVPGATGAASAVDPVLVLATLGHYARLVLWPHPGSFDPAFVDAAPDGTPTGLGPMAALGALVLGALLVCGVLAARRPALRPWTADAAWFLVPLLPVLNLVVRDPTSLAHERFLYLPLLGVSALVARGLALAMASGGARRTIVLGASALPVVLSGVASLSNVEHFSSDVALRTHELEVHPDRGPAYAAFIDAMRAEHAYDEAEAAALAGASLARAGEDAVGEALFLLRWSQTRLDTLSDADQEELRALRTMYDGYLETRRLRFSGEQVAFDVQVPARAPRLDGDATRRAQVLIPRATVYLRTGALEEAEAQLRALLEDSPRSAGLWNLLTLSLARRGDFRGALAAADQAERVLPGSPVLRAVRVSVERAGTLAAAPAADPLALAVREAQVQLALGAPFAAGQALAPALSSTPTDHALVHLRAQIHVTDRRFDLAREGIERARQAAPGDPFFAAELAQLDAAEAQASTR